MELHVISISPGRVQFTFPVEESDYRLLDVLFSIDGVKKQVFNKTTKRLEILFEPETLSLEKLFREIRRRLPGLRLQWGQGAGRQSRPLFDLHPYGRFVHRLLRGTNRWLERSTGGFGDLGAIAPTVMLGLGAVEFLRRPSQPRWFDYVWYAANFQYWYLREARDRVKDALANNSQAVAPPQELPPNANSQTSEVDP